MHAVDRAVVQDDEMYLGPISLDGSVRGTETNFHLQEFSHSLT